VVLRLLQSLARTGCRKPLGCSPSPGVSCPSALAIAGAHSTRVYLARYVAPSGFVSPLGAFLLPRPPRPCFMPRTLVGFALRSVSLRGEGSRLSTRPCPPVVGSNGARLPSTGLARLLGFAPSGSSLRTHREIPASCPMLPWASSPPGISSLSRRLPVSRSLLSQASRGRRSPSLLLRVSITTGPVCLRGDYRPS
jgi:hypothetical protein